MTDRGIKKSRNAQTWRLIQSSLIDLAHFESLTGSPAYHEIEFLDLFGLCIKSEQEVVAPFFAADYYVGINKDLDISAGEAFRHFLQYGLQEWRNPHPLIDLRYVAQLHPGVFLDVPAVETFIDLLENNIVDPSPFFSIREYHAQLPESERAGSAVLHYLTKGAKSGLKPNPYFDPLFYARTYEDVPKTGADCFLHFVLTGDREKRKPNAKFDPEDYESRYPNASALTIGPLEYYLRIGRFEGHELSAPGSAGPGRGRNGPATANWIAETDASSWLIGAERLKTRSAQHMHDRIIKFGESDVRPVRDVDHELAINVLRFAQYEEADIDIMIPCYNEFELTIECLRSIAEQVTDLKYRIIVLDDASPDQRLTLLGNVPGLIYHRNPENLHFLRSCNAGLALCRSPYLLLLNNDAQLFPDCLEQLFRALTSSAEIAAVGPKILYPNGRLQESGFTIMPNATTKMIGVGDDPATPCYNYPRVVNGISGACLLVRRDAIGDQLFDPLFAPAYCEDADLCLRLRAAGKTILYVPAATAVHHLSVSTSKDSETRRRRLITKNQEKLYQKWSDFLREQAKVRVLAYYLPQFHPTKENDLWWGKGFTEWTNVTRALPSFDGHYQPHLPSDLGYYHLNHTGVMQQQQLLARRYGIEGFVVYYYNFKSGPILEKPLELILADPSIDFNFCPCWANENWTKHWDGGEKEILLEQGYDDATMDRVCVDAVRFANDPRSIKVNGKPMFLVYRPLLFPDVSVFARKLRAAYREAGWPDGHLVYVESMEAATKGIDPRSIGFDACVEFPPQGIGADTTKKLSPTKAGWKGYVYDYEDTVVNACARDTTPYPRYPAVFPSWDNTARQPLKGTSFIGLGGEFFQHYVAVKTAFTRDFFVGEEQMLFVNAWNEWAEGAHLEPDQAYGHTWLEGLRNGVATGTWPGRLN